jgi:predicted outer membrane repeat protein
LEADVTHRPEGLISERVFKGNLRDDVLTASKRMKDIPKSVTNCAFLERGRRNLWPSTSHALQIRKIAWQVRKMLVPIITFDCIISASGASILQSPLIKKTAHSGMPRCRGQARWSFALYRRQMIMNSQSFIQGLRSRPIKVLSILFLFLALCTGHAEADVTYSVEGILYAISGGTGDCSSWENACELQTALTNAVSGDEIWVAAGTHKPTATETDRTATFQLKEGVAVYGGFVGTESSRAARNPAVNVTILSGDIDNNDSQTPIITDLATMTGNTTNSYHVVTGATGATLDGFTITAGYADNTLPFGGGMYNNASPILTNVTFSGNSAITNGGGMYNSGGSPSLTNVTFSGNSAVSGSGGGMANLNSSPTLTNVTFNGNSASSYGGGMYNESSTPSLTNVTFSGNSATTYGGGMYNFHASSVSKLNL